MADYPQAPTLFEFAQKSSQLDEIARRRAIDEEAARRSLQLQQVMAGNQLTLQKLAQNLGNAQLTGLLQKQLESQASPEMSQEYGGQAQKEGLRLGQQGLQDFLMAPERQPDYQPQKKGLGGFLQRAFTPQVERGYSAAQQGLLANTLAGQPVQGTDSGMPDFRLPEQRQESQLRQSQIAENVSRGKYYTQGGASGGEWVKSKEGKWRWWRPGEPLNEDDVPRTAKETEPTEQYMGWHNVYVKEAEILSDLQLEPESKERDAKIAASQNRMGFAQKQIGHWQKRIESGNGPEVSGGAPAPKPIEESDRNTGEQIINGARTGKVAPGFPDANSPEMSRTPATDRMTNPALAPGFGSGAREAAEMMETEAPAPVESQQIQGTLARVAPGEMAGSVSQPSGKVRMRSPNGKPYDVDASEVQEATKNGWTVLR